MISIFREIYFSLKWADMNLFYIVKVFETPESLKGVFAKNERGYRLNAIKKRF